jgi:hypothetical protein
VTPVKILSVTDSLYSDSFCTSRTKDIYLQGLHNQSLRVMVKPLQYMHTYISYPYVLTLGRADTHLPDLTLCFSTLPCDEGRLPEYSIFEDHEEFKSTYMQHRPCRVSKNNRQGLCYSNVMYYKFDVRRMDIHH